MNIKILGLSIGLAALASYSFAQQPADHLLISELGVYAASGFSNAPSSAEYTEIYNPTASAVDLSNYYLTDHGTYFDLPAVVAGQTDNLLKNGSDFLIKFPSGAIIPSGGTVVVTNNGTSFTQAYFYDDYSGFTGQTGAPQLFEIWDSSPTIQNMGTNYNMASADYPLAVDRNLVPINDQASNMSHTDAGEYTVLFYWDGSGPLVKDADIVQYLPTGLAWGDDDDQYRNKSGLPAAGPNGEFGTYALEFGTINNMDVKYPSGVLAQLTRRSILEVGETLTGGNGLNGHDETMENNNLTWEMVTGAPTNASPGVSNLPLASANQPPVVGKSSRDIQRPAPGTTVRITAPIYDNGAFTPKLMVDKGTGTFAATTMTNEGGNMYGANISTSGLAEGTHVKWYVEATDAGGLTSTEAQFLPLGEKEKFSGYHVFMVKTGTYSQNDLIISEIMYDPQGGNNYHHAQYVEIYNPATTPFNFGSYVLKTSSYPSISTKIPEGTIIPPKGFVVIAGSKEIFRQNYPGMDLSKVVNYGLEDAGDAFMAHAGSTFQIFDPNVFEFDSTPVDASAAFKTMAYQNVAPWPIGSPQGTGAGNTGYSIELKTLVSGADNNAANWAQSTVYNGTPLAFNSVDAANRPGGNYIAVSNVARDTIYPTAFQPVIVSATVTTTATLTGVELRYSVNNSAYTSVVMASTNGQDYTGLIPGQVDNALIKFYVMATDTIGNSGSFPYTAPTTIVPFRVQTVPAKSNAVVMNELMYDPRGTDNGTYPEFIELHNPTDLPVDISYYMIARNGNLAVDNQYNGVFEEGTIIPPHGYYLVTPRKDLFVRNYVNPYPNWYHDTFGDIDPNNVMDLFWAIGGSHMANGNTSTFYLVHVNEVDFYTGTNCIPFVAVNYKTSAPWPAMGATINGPSIELRRPDLDPNDPLSWGLPPMFHGTPLNDNVVPPPSSNVGDWNLY